MQAVNFYFAITRSEYRGGPNSTNQEGSHQTPRYSAKNDGYCNVLALQDFRGEGALDHLGIILVLSSQRVLHKPGAVIKQLLSATYVSKSFLRNKCAHVNFPKEVVYLRFLWSNPTLPIVRNQGGSGGPICPLRPLLLVPLQVKG